MGGVQAILMQSSSARGPTAWSPRACSPARVSTCSFSRPTRPGPGGAVGSEAATRPGFLHDVGAAFFPWAKLSPAFRSLPLEEHGLRWRPGGPSTAATPPLTAATPASPGITIAPPPTSAMPRMASAGGDRRAGMARSSPT